MHDYPIDMSWLRQCSKFQLVFNDDISKFSEVLVYDVLKQHPFRTYESKNASLFYLPIWEWTSMRIGICQNTTHRQRMNHVANALRKNPIYKMYAEKHFWITSASQASWQTTDIKKEFGDLENRMYDLKHLLSPTIVGQRKVQSKKSSTIASRVFEIPYATFPPAERIDRIYFAGSFDVCCTGRAIRCKLAQLYQNPHVQFFDRVRPNSTRHCGRHIPTCLQPHCENDMQKYSFCVVPAGDTAVTARLYTSIAASCIPIIISPTRGSFRESVDYTKFAINIHIKDFLKDPSILIRIVQKIDKNTKLKMYHELKKAQRHLLWYSNISATHVLQNVKRLQQS